MTLVWVFGFVICAMSHWAPPAFAIVREEEVPSPRGVVIEEIPKGSVLHKVGIKPGDVFYRWERLPNPPVNPEAASGVFDSPFDWMLMEIEQAPRGEIKLVGERNGKAIVFFLTNRLLKTKTRPVFSSEFEKAIYTEGWRDFKKNRFKAGMEKWQKLPDSPWICFRKGILWRNRRNWKLSQDQFMMALKDDNLSKRHELLILYNIVYIYYKQNQFQTAIQTIQIGLEKFSRIKGLDLLRANFLNSFGNLSYIVGKINEAEIYFLESIKIRQVAVPKDPRIAAGLNNLGHVFLTKGRIEKAKSYFLQSLEIEQRLAPNSLAVAASIDSLGLIARKRGEMEIAKKYHLEALKIKEKLNPSSLSVANTLNNLGVLANGVGELERASRYHNLALEIRKTHSPDSIEVAASYSNLGLISYNRRRLDVAERHYRKALSIQTLLAPNGISFSQSLFNLGDIARNQGDLDRAERYYFEALKIREEQVPNSHHVASCLNNLGIIARKKGEFDKAVSYYLQSLEIWDHQKSNSYNTANTLINLGIVAGNREKFQDAENFLLRAHKIIGKLATNNILMSHCLYNLGYLAFIQGEYGKAEKYLLRDIQILEKDAPFGFGHAQSLALIGDLLHRQAKVSMALDYYYRAAKVFESQSTNLGGTQEIKSLFRGNNQAFHQKIARIHLDQRQFKLGFQIFERHRARTLLEMMAERDIDFGDNQIPLELLQSRDLAGFQYQKTQEKLRKLTLGHPDVEGLRDQLFENHRQYDAINAQIRESFPKLAPPKPLELPQIKAALGPGTVLMSFCVLEKQTALFLVRKDADLQVITISEGGAFWDEKVSEILGGAFMDHTKLFFPDFLKQSGVLYKLLIAPAMPHLGSAERLVVIPDGALKKLPFALLYDLQSQRYLIEKKPLSTVVSATVYAELKSRQNKPLQRMVALGDPLYPHEDLQPSAPVDVFFEEMEPNRAEAVLIPADHDDTYDFSVQSRIARHGPWSRLPQTANEVNRIAVLFGDQSQTYLRTDATEDVAKAVGEDVDVVHIAAHAFTDDHRALDSGLVLTLNEDFQEGEENGILHAWEIIESMRLDANLVVLSACQTGLGKEAGGEGLIGLTHAFQFAGARSILASYWNVNDASTAVLMEKFYRYLKQGHDKATALQKAQIDLIRHPIKLKRRGGLGRFLPAKNFDASHPYHWAAFQLIGPWD